MTTRLLRKCGAHFGQEVGSLRSLWVPCGLTDENVTMRSLGFPASGSEWPSPCQGHAARSPGHSRPCWTHWKDESSPLPINATYQPFD